MTALAEQATKILYQALELDLGAVYRVVSDDDSPSPALRAKQILYRFRSELGDPELKRLQIRLDPHFPDTQLWVIKTDD